MERDLSPTILTCITELARSDPAEKLMLIMKHAKTGQLTFKFNKTLKN